MISISILPGETRYLRAPSLSPVRNSVDSFDLIIVVFRFCGKRVKEKQRRAAVEGRGERAGERENADTGILPWIFQQFLSRSCELSTKKERVELNCQYVIRAMTRVI